MKNLMWRNNSSVDVDWVVITELGSASGRLCPGESYSEEAVEDIKQMGMHCATAPVYILDNISDSPEIKRSLIASDVIPMKSR